MLLRVLLAITLAVAVVASVAGCSGLQEGDRPLASSSSEVSETPAPVDPSPEDFAGRVYQVTSLSVEATGVFGAAVPDDDSSRRTWAGFWHKGNMAAARRLVAKHFGDAPYRTRLIRGGYGWWVVGTDGSAEVGACNPFDGGYDLMPREKVLYDSEDILRFFRAQLAGPE